MAENQILIKFKPDGHEELIKAIQKLSTVQKKLTDSVNKVKKSSEKATKTINKLEKANEKAAVASSKAAKSSGLLDTSHKRLAATNTAVANSFATIRSKMLLWSFAMSMGVRQLGRFAQEAATLKAMETAFNTLSGGTNNATIAIDKLKEATDNTMSEFDLFQQANNAMILGITKNSDEMAEMFDVAQRLGRALGKDTKMSVESLITGIGRQSRLMLDNIGIIVKSDEAYEAYAQRLGKTADALSDAEKKQAFLTATMESAREKVDKVGVEVFSAKDSFSELSASMDDLQARIGDAILAFEPLINLASSFMDAITSERIDRFIRAIGLIIDIFKVLAGVIAVILIPPLLYFVGIGGTISAIVAKISSSFILAGATALTASYGVLAIKDAITKYLDPAEKLTEQQKRFNEAFEQGADTLADEDIGSSFETLEEQMLQYGSSVETVTNALYFQMLASDLVREMYGKTKEGQLEALDAQLAVIDAIALEIGMTNELSAVYDMLIERKEKLNGTNKDSTEEINKNVASWRTLDEVMKASEEQQQKFSKSIVESSFDTSQAYDNMGEAINAALSDALIQTIKFMTVKLMEDAISKFGWLGIPLAATAGAVAGSLVGQAQRHVKFEDGGLVGGRRHSQGGTMIEAERGEFVMSRNAVDAIGVENLNRMNQGGGGAVSVTFTGNVMSQDFIENEAIPQIKDAIRRGADIGVS